MVPIMVLKNQIRNQFVANYWWQHSWWLTKKTRIAPNLFEDAPGFLFCAPFQVSNDLDGGSAAQHTKRYKKLEAYMSQRASSSPPVMVFGSVPSSMLPIVNRREVAVGGEKPSTRSSTWELYWFCCYWKFHTRKKGRSANQKRLLKNSTRLLQNSTVSQVGFLFEYLVEKAQRKVVGIFLLIIRNS